MIHIMSLTLQKTNSSYIRVKNIIKYFYLIFKVSLEYVIGLDFILLLLGKC